MVQVTSGDVNRLFLQAIISRKYVSMDLARALWKACIEAVKAADDALDIEYRDDRNSWEKFLVDVNASINGLDLEIAHLHDEITGREMLALVNRNGDEVAQIATGYSPVEIAFFKALIEQIMTAPNESYSVSSLAALRELNNLEGTKMSKSQGEIVLESFVAKGWLYKSERGRYSLTTRTILELMPYLRSTYADEVLECTICLELLTRGKGCYTCGVRMHTHCFSKYRATKVKCPQCGSDWASHESAAKLVEIGEKAAGGDGDYNTRRSKKRASTEEDSDDDRKMSQTQEDDEEEEPTQTQTQRKSRRSNPRRGSAPQSQADAEMDVDEEEEEASPAPTQRRGNRRRG